MTFPKTESRCRLGRLPVGLVCTLCMVTAVESLVASAPVELSDYMSLSWRASALRARTTRSDVICLGDSLVKVGLLPNEIERGSGYSVENLAVFGGQACSSFFLLRRALESGCRPSAVLVDFEPNLLAAVPKSSAPYWADLLDARDAVDLVWHTRDVPLVTRASLAWLLPSHKGREVIRRSIRHALAGAADPEWTERRELVRNWTVNRGAHIVTDPSRTSPTAAVRNDGPSVANWAPSRINRLYLRRLINLAAANDVTLCWVLPPTTPSYQEHRRRIGVTQRYERMIHDFQSQYPGLIALDARSLALDDSFFRDRIHLNQRGAVALSAAVATALSRASTGSRWIALAPGSCGKDGLPAHAGDLPRVANVAKQAPVR